MMHGPEKSDLAIVAGKPANKAEQSAAESVERRAGTKGNANQQSTHWTQSQARVSQALERIRQAFAVTHPRWEPYAGKPHVRFWCSDSERVPNVSRSRYRCPSSSQWSGYNARSAVPRSSVLIAMRGARALVRFLAFLISARSTGFGGGRFASLSAKA
jgi:hypothetical protein